MGLPSKELTALAGAYDLLGICDRGWRAKTLWECVPNPRSWGGEMTIDPTVDVLKELLPLFGRDVVLQDSRAALL